MDQFEQYSLKRLIKLIWLIAIILVAILITIMMSSFGSAQYSINDQQSLVPSSSFTSNSTVTVNNSLCWIGLCTQNDIVFRNIANTFNNGASDWNYFLTPSFFQLRDDLPLYFSDGNDCTFRCTALLWNDADTNGGSLYLPNIEGTEETIATTDDIIPLTNPFNQHLNTTSNSTFVRVQTNGVIIANENSLQSNEQFFIYGNSTDTQKRKGRMMMRNDGNDYVGISLTENNTGILGQMIEFFVRDNSNNNADAVLNLSGFWTKNISSTDWIFGNKLLLSQTGNSIFPSTTFQVTTQDVASGLITLPVISMIGGAGVLAGAIRNGLWILPQDNSQTSQLLLLKDTATADSWLFSNNNNTGTLELKRFDPVSGAGIRGAFNMTGNFTATETIRAGNFSSANGTIGFSGTCSTFNITVLNGLIVECT